VFKDGPDIQPYLEEKDSGPTFDFCSDLAKRIGCIIIAGFPEALEESESREPHQVGANSAMIVAPSGDLITVYRKTNLYETDLPWAKPGTGLLSIHLPPPVDQSIALGICNDLNPHPPNVWESIDEGPYELATFAKEANADCLIILCAWLSSVQEAPPRADPHPDNRTIFYWMRRLRQLLGEEEDGEEEDGEEGNDDGNSESEVGDTPAAGANREPKPLSILICNRSGADYGATSLSDSHCVLKNVRYPLCRQLRCCPSR
jgi:protein N-terminal amidase